MTLQLITFFCFSVPLKCPPGRYFMFADRFDKRRAIVCNDGTMEILRCPDELEFFSDTKSCDIPRKVQEAMSKLIA